MNGEALFSLPVICCQRKERAIVMKAVRKSRLVVMSALLLLLAGCTQVPLTGRQQLILVPDSMMNEMSLQAYQEFLAGHTLSSNRRQTEMVERVGGKISSAVERYCVEHGLAGRVRGYHWQFNLIEDPSVNAWAMPGGKVVVYTGLMSVAGDEAGLAVVMGHEIAHVFARHGAERMTQGLMVEFGGMALSKAVESKPAGTRDLFMRSYGMGTQLGLLLPYSRRHESEADRLGMIFMAMAGYHPSQAVAFWQRMAAAKTGQAPPEILSTHPADATRIRDIKSLLPEAVQYYQPQ